MASPAEDLPLAAAFARGLEVFTRMQSGDADAEALASGAAAMRHAVAVSYTHLTLPTILRV